MPKLCIRISVDVSGNELWISLRKTGGLAFLLRDVELSSCVLDADCVRLCVCDSFCFAAFRAFSVFFFWSTLSQTTASCLANLKPGIRQIN